MAGKRVNAGHVVGAEGQDKSAAEELLEAKGDSVIIGDEESSEESDEESEVIANSEDRHESVEKEPEQKKDSNQWVVMLKRAGSYWGRGKGYQRDKAVAVSQEEYLYLLGTGLFDEVR